MYIIIVSILYSIIKIMHIRMYVVVDLKKHVKLLGDLFII